MSNPSFKISTVAEPTRIQGVESVNFDNISTIADDDALYMTVNGDSAGLVSHVLCLDKNGELVKVVKAP